MAEDKGKVIVLGATGFLGAYSCLALRSAGHAVVAVGHRASDGGFFKEHGIAYIGGFSIERRDCFDALPTDACAVVNLAGSMPARADFCATDYIDSIVSGTLNLCEWLCAKSSCRKVVFNTTPSDVWREFGVGVRVDDDAPRSYPATAGDHDIYAIAKIAATDILDHYRLAAGIKSIVFRHMNVYGFHPSAKYMVDGEERMSPWRILMRRAIAGEKISIYGDASRKLELLSVYDFASAVVCAVDANCSGLFNLAGDRPYTLEEEIRTIVDVFGSGNQIDSIPDRPSRMETVLKREKVRQLLSWEPRYCWKETCCLIRREFAENRFRKLWGEVQVDDITPQTLAVVGASHLQLPLVRKAKEMGLRVVCFAWAEGAVCADYCDAFYPISIVEKEKILEVCKRERVDGIVSIASDVAVPTISFVAEALGLPGNSQSSALKSTNKAEMRKALAAAGVSVPAFTEIRDVSELENAVCNMSFPLIVKPVDRSGSMGVVRVDDFEALRTAVSESIQCSFCKAAVVEECITDMHEISVEGLSIDGEYRILAITDKITTGAPHFVELGHHQPSLISDEIRQRVESEVRKGISALDIACGASHAELMITSDGRVYVTEIGARMGGDFIGAELVWLSTGFDFLRAVVCCALGEPVRMDLEAHEKCAGVWFYSPQTEWVKDVISTASNCDRVVKAELLNIDVRELTKSADRSGYFVYAAPNRWMAPDK